MLLRSSFLFFSTALKTKGMVVECPVKKGGKCPYKDKKECPIRVPKEIKPPREKTVYLIGTVHVSKESAKRVEDVIRTVLPGMVCLELDPRRFQTMQEMMGHAPVEVRDMKSVNPPQPGLGTAASGASGEGKDTKPAFREGGHFPYSGSASGSTLKGQTPPLTGGTNVKTQHAQATPAEMLTLPGVLKWLQQQIGDEFGVAPGSEMISAYETARKYGLDIALIDRPVEVTINRMWDGMKFSEKMRLFTYLTATMGVFFLRPLFKNRVMSLLGGTKTLDLGKLEKGEGVDDLMSELEAKFPALHKALVEERNTYMCNNILHILRTRVDTVAVVVGMGHATGMKTQLEQQGVRVVV
jgi:pheromone shutdown protein TraB